MITRKKKGKQDRALGAALDRLQLGDKPYFAEATMETWKQRVKRLEMKMNVLAPELVATSFELHERALQFLRKKIEKIIVEEARRAREK